MSESESANYIDTYWSGERGLLETVVGVLSKDARVAAVGPMRDVSIGGTTHTIVLLRTTEPLGTPPDGITDESAATGSIAVGVFMAQPRRPTPWEWVNRIPDMVRQAEILTALDAVPELRSYKERLFLTQEVNVDDPVTQNGLSALLDAEIITQEEYDLLSAETLV